MELVVAKGGEDAEMSVAPRLCFGVVYGVVVFHIAGQGNVAVQDDGGRVLGCDLLDQPVADARIGGAGVGEVGEALI